MLTDGASLTLVDLGKEDLVACVLGGWDTGGGGIASSTMLTMYMYMIFDGHDP